MSEISFSMKMDWLQCIGQSDEAIRGFKLNMLLYELLSLLYSRFVSGVRRPELVRSGRNITMQIIGYMTSHRKQHLEATDVAREFGYGREHFCRLFRKATGNVQRISDRPAIGRRLQKTVRFLCVDSQHRKGMRFPRYARAADGRATQIRHTRAGISRTIRKSKLTFNERRRKYDWACTNHPSYEN